jgi:hypothetical protein
LGQKNLNFPFFGSHAFRFVEIKIFLRYIFIIQINPIPVLILLALCHAIGAFAPGCAQLDVLSTLSGPPRALPPV